MISNRSKILYLFVIASLIANVVKGQYWNKKSYEGIFGIGASNFMADVGSPRAAPASSIKNYFWITPQTFRPVFFSGIRYKLNDRIAFKFNLIAGNLSAADIYSDKLINNLISNVYLAEISGQFEYYLNKEKKKQNIYRLKSYKWLKNIPLTSYLFIGVGETFFYSKTLINERYVNVPGFKVNFDRPEKYSNTTPVIPFGLGFKFRLNKIMRFGVEAGYRFAFSDYLDEKKSSSGDNWPDSYQFVLFSLNYKLRTGRNGLPVLRGR